MSTAFVYGDLIKRKRKQLGLTQEKLCDLANNPVEVTTLRAMENNGDKRFRFEKIKSIASILELRVDDIVKPEIHSFVEIIQPRKLDFRCMADPHTVTDWRNSRLAISILPLYLRIDKQCPEDVTLESATLSIPDKNEKEKYQVFYHVAMNPAGSGWLGCVNDFRHLRISPAETHEAEYMFRSESPLATTWSDFVDFIRYREEAILEIDIRYEFQHDYHDLKLEFSVLHMQELLKSGFQNAFGYPRYIQPRVHRMKTVFDT